LINAKTTDQNATLEGFSLMNNGFIYLGITTDDSLFDNVTISNDSSSSNEEEEMNNNPSPKANDSLSMVRS